MPTSPIKRSKSKRNQQTIQQRTHQEVATSSGPTLEELFERIESLEDKVVELKSILIVSKNVNKLLSQEVDELHQYQSIACIILDEIIPSEHETTEEITKKAKNVVAKSLKFSEFFRERS